MSAFESAQNGNLVAADEIRVGEAQASWTVRDTTAVDIDGGTSDATRYLVLRADAANRALASGIDTNRYRMGRDTGTGSVNTIRIADAYARVEGIQVEQGTLSIGGNSGLAADGVLAFAIGCRILVTPGGFGFAAVGAAGELRMANCIAHHDSGTGPTALVFAYQGVIRAYACTTDRLTNGAHWTTSNGGSYIVKNCLAYGTGAGTTCFAGTITTGSCNNNASRDSSAPGSSSLTSIADPFANHSTVDLRIAIGVSSRAAGADLSADGTFPISVDIDDAPRPTSGGWTIGAWEPPWITALSPADGATGVSTTADLIITFSKDVTIGSGVFEVVETGVGTAESVTLPDAAVTVTSNVVTWDRSVTLTGSTGYHATLASGGVDLFAGISGTTAWNWTTAAGTSPMVADLPMALDVAGTLTGSGALAGDVPMALALSGTLSGSGALVGDLPAALTLSGELTGAGALVGDIPVALELSGSLTGAGALTGDLPVALDLSGALIGAGALSAAAPLELDLSGTLTGSGAMTADLPGALVLTGTLTALSPDAMVADIPMALVLSGALTGSGAMSGALTGALGLSGALTGAGALQAALEGALAMSGELRGAGALAADLTGGLVLSGELTNLAGAMTADLPMGLAMTGTLTGLGSMTADMPLRLTLTGALSGGAGPVAYITGTWGAVQPGVSATWSTVEPGVRATFGSD